jgi:uncharacterized phage protein (TIGR02218 family)
MPTWIDADLTSLAFLWRLERRDGVTLGLTSHDRDVELDGLLYRAAPGMVPSAIERSDDLETDTVELRGALTHDAIRADDLAAGRWDGAALLLSAINWSQPESAAIPMIRGELGSIELADDQFTVMLRGPTVVLEAAVHEDTTPDCRAQLGDKRCRVDMAARRSVVRIVSVTGTAVTLDQIIADGVYVGGTLRWIDGANCGLEARITGASGAMLTLDETPPFAITGVTRVELTQGCDKRFATCVTRFANAANFRGEPHVPGNDLLTRYAS